MSRPALVETFEPIGLQLPFRYAQPAPHFVILGAAKNRNLLLRTFGPQSGAMSTYHSRAESLS